MHFSWIYPLVKKGWRVYDLKTVNLFVSCDVTFDEKNLFLRD